MAISNRDRYEDFNTPNPCVLGVAALIALALGDVE